MIYESTIELIKHYDNCGKIERIAEILFDSDDDAFYDEQDREDLRPESVPRIANAIKSLPMQLIALAPTIGEEVERQIALVPINAYDTQQIANDSPIGEGDDYTYRLCRKWETRCFEVTSLDRIGGYLSSRPVVKSIDDLDGIPTSAWDVDGFRLCKPDIVPSGVFAIAPVIIEDGLDEQDELSAVVSIIDVIAMYGFDLAAGDRAKEKDIRRIRAALERAEREAETGNAVATDADRCLDEIARRHGFAPKPREAVERDRAITLESVWREFDYETEFVRDVISPIAEDIRDAASKSRF